MGLLLQIERQSLGKHKKARLLGYVRSIAVFCVFPAYEAVHEQEDSVVCRSVQPYPRVCSLID
jgi:hypothetical protein